MNNRSPTSQTAQTAGYSDWLAADGAAADYIATRIASKFGVSVEVIAKRLRAEKLVEQLTITYCGAGQIWLQFAGH